MFARKRKPELARQASTDGRMVYAIGDLHGRADLLQALLTRIAADVIASKPAARPVLIFVGDYIDRGPSSKGVIDRVLSVGRSGFEVRTLMGNHERTLLQFLEDPAVGPLWAAHGGVETLVDYGVAPPSIDASPGAWADARDAFAAQAPPRHLKFLAGLETQVVYGDYLFVHAGVRPGVPLVEQTEHDLLTIRGEFLTAVRPNEKIVVHGHTPTEAPFSGPHRINVDTGAYATGVLTAVKLQDAARRFLQVEVEKAPAVGVRTLSKRFRTSWLDR